MARQSWHAILPTSKYLILWGVWAPRHFFPSIFVQFFFKKNLEKYDLTRDPKCLNFHSHVDLKSLSFSTEYKRTVTDTLQFLTIAPSVRRIPRVTTSSCRDLLPRRWMSVVIISLELTSIDTGALVSSESDQGSHSWNGWLSWPDLHIPTVLHTCCLPACWTDRSQFSTSPSISSTLPSSSWVSDLFGCSCRFSSSTSFSSVSFSFTVSRVTSSSSSTVKIALSRKIGKHVLSYFKTRVLREQISDNTFFENRVCTGSGRRTPILKFIFLWSRPVPCRVKTKKREDLYY